MKNHKNADIYDFSDYAEEITGDALFKINGGAEVENSHEGVAGANVGDTITRNDGTVVVLNQGDINYANENRLRKLFDEEKISEADFLERRVKEVKPHMDNLHSWLLEKKQKEMILDSSKTKEAVNYCLNRWENLENFIKYPEATFSTNAAERSVKAG